jgi:hypothetical protein
MDVVNNNDHIQKQSPHDTGCCSDHVHAQLAIAVVMIAHGSAANCGALTSHKCHLGASGAWIDCMNK